jgi:large subunit ribosomal protein L32
MAHPKRRHSHARTMKKRTHNKLDVPVLVTCPHCKKLKLSHKVCPYCGYYKGKEVIIIERKEKKK